ncbi:MAG TPA: bacillithiol biosynthesis cysteine-adding enzyme BshC [Acidobacteriota bacterium]
MRVPSPALLEDLLAGGSAARELFPWAPGAESALEAARSPRAGSAPRAAVCDRIAALLARLDAPPAAQQALETLRRPETVCVVTGQQLGLWGGPLYTSYKLIGALLQARALERQGQPAVAVFWLEGEDHDYSEVARLVLPDREDRPVLWQAPERPDQAGRPVAGRIVPPELSEAFSTFEASTPETEFKAELLRRLRRAHDPEATFAIAFARWLVELFGAHGVLCIDPTDPELKHLAAPLFERIGARSNELAGALAQRNQRLETLGYAPQVQRDPQRLPLFVLQDGVRVRMNELSGAELAARARSEPETLSPDVLLRPLYQDFLLPTAAYVAGPSEVSYLAQAAALYPVAEVRMPAIVPRPHGLIVEARSRRLQERLGIELAELLAGDADALKRRVVPPHDSDQAIERLQRRVGAELESLRGALLALDPNLSGPLEKSGRELDQVFSRLRGKLERSVQQRHEQSLEQLRRLLDQLFPLGQPQERVFGLPTYMVRYGLDLPQRLLAQLELLPGELQQLDPSS